MATTKQSPERTVDSSLWNYHPAVPIPIGGVFQNLLNPVFVLKGILFSWFGIYIRGIYLLLISALWLTVFPSMETIGAGGWGWVLQICFINMALMLAWAGGLHLHFYTFARQGRYLQFSMNRMETGTKFFLGDQVWDNMFWTLAWGVPIWTFYECGLLWLLAQGAIPSNSWEDGPVWFVLFFVLIPFWDSAHFYTVHRLLHWNWLYKHVHAVHHRNINVGPWSGLSMHPVETAIYLSVVMVHLVLPSHPLHIVFHISWYAMGPCATHCGFEAISIAGGKYPRLGDFFHQLHHRFFECNYGNSEVPLDKLSGHFHDGTQAATRKMRERMKQDRKVRS